MDKHQQYNKYVTLYWPYYADDEDDGHEADAHAEPEMMVFSENWTLLPWNEMTLLV